MNAGDHDTLTISHRPVGLKLELSSTVPDEIEAIPRVWASRLWPYPPQPVEWKTRQSEDGSAGLD